jgi:uncharacterized membrane protein
MNLGITNRGTKFSIFVILSSVFAVVPFLGISFFESHDAYFHLDRLVLFDNALRQGCLYPRWIQELAYGYGMPLFNFFPPLAYYIGELFHLLGTDFPAAILLTFIIGFVLSGIMMYLFANEIIGEIPAVVAAVAYIYAPYHLLDAYIRGGLPEFLAFIFLPLIYFSIIRASNKAKYFPLISISYAAIILTHNAMALISTPFILLFILIHEEKLKSLLSLLIGLGLSGFYWIPALAELKNIHPITTYYYIDHFLYFPQLLNKVWGGGLSVPGPSDGMGFHIGNIHLVFSLLAFYLLFKESSKIRKYIVYFAFVFAVSVFFTLNISSSITGIIPFFDFIQFPWRFLFITTFAVSFLSASFLTLFEKKKEQRAFAAILGILILLYSTPFLYTIPSTNNSLELHTFTNITKTGPKTVVGAVEDELLPRWVMNYSILRRMERVKWPQGTIQQSCNNYYIEVNNSEQLNVLLPIFYFPGWRIDINGIETQISLNENGLITLPLEEGVNTIQVHFEDTKPIKISKILTFISLISLLAVIVNKKNSFFN